MSDQSLNIFSLRIATKLLTGSHNIESFQPAEVSFISRSHNLFLSFYSKLYGSESDPGVYEDFNYFVENVAPGDLQKIAEILEHPQEGQEKEKEENESEKKEEKEEEKIAEPEKPEKEVSSIPAELETMVALYKEHQADLLDLESNTHSIAETIKRARKSWLEKEKIRLVYENADKEREQKEKADEQYRLAVNPKEKSRKEILKNTYEFAEIALLAHGGKELSSDQFKEALDNIVYLAETGAIEIDNYNELSIVSSLAIKDQVSIKTEFDQLDNLIQERQKLLETEGDLDEVNKIDSSIILTEQEVEKTFREHSKNIRNQLESINKDYDNYISEAKKEIDTVIINLEKAFPNAKLPFQQPEISPQKIAELETIIRKVDPTALNVNPVGLGARTAATLQVTGGSANINAGIVDLYSKGLTKEKYEELTKDPNSPVSKYLNKAPNLRKQIENGIKKYSRSSDGVEIENQLKKLGKTGEFVSHLPTSVQKALHPIQTAENYINKKIGEYAGRQILKNTNSAIAKKLGNYVLENGLKAGAKKFADEVAKKVLIAAAKKAGVSAAKAAGMVAAESAIAAASVALGISTAGLSLIIEAGILLITAGFAVIKKGVQEIKNALGITEEDDKENKKAFLVGLGALAATAFAVNRGAKMFGIATKAAVISAVGIIWLSIATIAVFLTLTFLTAPILTTLVQFDSMEKVKYGDLTEPITPTNCSNMAWPFEGTHPITQGPRQTNTSCTHGGNIAESVDFSIPNGVEIQSISDGVVTSVGNDGDTTGYGKFVKIKAKTDKGEEFIIIYGHLAEYFVSQGQSVKAKQKIGLSDNTGYSTGPHLHLGYIGIEYNSCPAGGFKVNENCCDTTTCNQP